jgi:hypothetical protein
MRLTKDQIEILDCLQDDYESVEQLRHMLEGRFTDRDIIKHLQALIEAGYVKCYEPTPTTLVHVLKCEPSRMRTYWFDLTDQGRAAIESSSYTRPLITRYRA